MTQQTSTKKISKRLLTDIAKYIKANYCDDVCEMSLARLPREVCDKPKENAARYFRATKLTMVQPQSVALNEECVLTIQSDLDTKLEQLDESFSQMLLRKIDEKGLTDAECYKKANVDRKLFSKIRSDAHYRPSKPTAIAFAIALELTLPETEELLKKAGFALSHSNKFDIIIEYFISNGRYNIFEINEALFAFDQSLLGV